MKKTAITVLGVLLSFAALCQSEAFREGFIRLHNGDALTGLIGNKQVGSEESIQLKQTTASEPQTFRASEIAGFDQGGIFYTSFQDGTKWVFVEIIFDGRLSLIQRNGFLFAFEKGKKFFHQLDETRSIYKGTLRKLMKSCKKVYSDISLARFTKEDLAAIFFAFDQCGSSRNRSVGEQGLAFALMVGAKSSSSTFTSSFAGHTSLLYDKVNDGNLISVSGDVYYQPAVTPGLAIYTGVTANPANYTQSGYTDFANYKEWSSFQMKYLELRVPVGIQYRIPTRTKSQMFGRVGMALPFISGFNYSKIDAQLIYPNGSVYTESSAIATGLEKKVQIEAMFGSEITFLGSHKLRFQLLFFTGKGALKMRYKNAAFNADGKFSGLSLSAGYVF